MLYYFSQQPDSIYPYLSSNNKLDLVDFIAADMDAVVVNKLDGNTKLEVVDSTFIKLQLNPATLVEMKLLPTTINLKDSSEYIIAVLTTYGVNAKESTISFYTSKWNKCNVHNPLKDIRINDLFDKSKTANGKDVKKIMNPDRSYRFAAKPSAYLLCCRIYAYPRKPNGFSAADGARGGDFL